VAACDQAHSSILNELEFFHVRRLAIWVPDSGSVTHHRLNQGLVSDEERLLVMAPGSAADSLQEVEALRALGCDVDDVIPERKLGVKGDTQDFLETGSMGHRHYQLRHQDGSYTVLTKG
jgi:hypothetical protein